MKYNHSKYQKIRELIESAEINKAIQKIIEIADLLDNTKSSDTARILQSRINVLKEKISKGIIDKEAESTERNQITSSVLDEIRVLEESEQQAKKIEEPFQENKRLSEEDIFRLAKAATIVIELEKIKSNFYKSEWQERADILGEVFRYSDHNTKRVAKEVFSFLSSVASLTRSGMDSECAYSVQALVIYYFPYFERGEEGEEYENFAFQCINLGDNIFYDASIYLNNLKVGVHGLQILKWIYWRGKERRIERIINKVKKTYDELQSTLNRPERDDLEDAKELLKIFREDLDNWGLTFPIIPNHLLRLI